MNDNQIAALAMSDSVEKNHNSTNSFKIGKSRVCLRIWQANNIFFEHLLRASISDKIEVAIYSPYFFIRDFSFSEFVNLYFTAENYDLVCEMDSPNLQDAFEYCGNNPQFAENWYKNFERRSLSVGDVVEKIENGESKFFLCNRIDWTEISSKIKSNSTIPVFKFKE